MLSHYVFGCPISLVRYFLLLYTTIPFMLRGISDEGVSERCRTVAGGQICVEPNLLPIGVATVWERKKTIKTGLRELGPLRRGGEAQLPKLSLVSLPHTFLHHLTPYPPPLNLQRCHVFTAYPLLTWSLLVLFVVAVLTFIATYNIISPHFPLQPCYNCHSRDSVVLGLSF